MLILPVPIALLVNICKNILHEPYIVSLDDQIDFPQKYHELYEDYVCLYLCLFIIATIAFGQMNATPQKMVSCYGECCKYRT